MTYKEKIKHFHDKLISMKEFSIKQKVLLFNFSFKIMAGKLHSMWFWPFVITNIFPYSALEVKSESTNKIFKVSGHRLKHQ